jgi:hypothetical protein
MRRIIITHCNISFQKVEFMKTLKLEFGCSLSLDRQPVQVNVAEEQFDRISGG